MSLKFSLIFFIPSLMVSCGKNDKFVYYQPLAQNNLVKLDDNKITDLLGSGSVDLLWIIDNSGSMSAAQQNVIKNAALFMDNFTKSGINWKLGLISTDLSENPYLGMNGSTFDNTFSSPVQGFQDAVSDLGTSGDGTEKTFEPLLKHLRNNPNFLRTDTPLVVIIVTDAHEQSRIDEKTFYKEFRKLIGEYRKLYVYSVLDAADNGCSGTSDDNNPLNYKGSPYEAFNLDSDGGKNYPMCSPKFGELLAEMSFDIKEKVQNLNLYLKSRPKPTSIKVTFLGNLLPGGPQKLGGYWYYDYGLNAISFYNVDFAKGDVTSVSVEYEKDDGAPEIMSFKK